MSAPSRLAVITPDYVHLDTMNAKEFVNRFGSVAAGADTVVIDMGKVQYVDSSGLGAILEIVRATLSRGARAAICEPLPAVKLLFKMVQLAKLLPVFETRAEANIWAEGVKPE